MIMAKKNKKLRKLVGEVDKNMKKLQIAKILKSVPVGAMGLGAVGATYGGPVGGAIGAQAGAMLQRKIINKANKAINQGIRRFVGSGDYAPVGNETMLGMVNTSSKLEIRSIANGIEIEGREFFTNFPSPGSTDFSFINFPFNPGLNSSLSKASQILGNYTTYIVEAAILSYEPMISKSSTSGSMGTIIMTSNPNSSDPPFQTFSEMVQFGGASVGVINEKLYHGIECKEQFRTTMSKYIRSGAVPADADIKTYDQFNVQIGSIGIDASNFPAGNTIGMVFIEYKIKAYNLHLNQALGRMIPFDTWYGGNTLTNARPFGLSPRKHNYSSIGGILSQLTDSIYTFPAAYEGKVMVIFKCQFTISMTLSVLSITPGGNVLSFNTAITGTNSNTEFYASNGTDGTIQTVARTFIVRKQTSSTPNTIDFDVDASAGTFTGSFGYIMQINPLCQDLVGNDSPMPSSF